MTSTAPVAQPEIDSPLPKSTAEPLSDVNEANITTPEDTEVKRKNTAETRNGKLTDRNEANVKKSCCCIL